MYHRLTASLRTRPFQAVAVLLALGGCSPDRDYGSLSGAVTYRGRPVVGLRVEVHRDHSGVSTHAPLDAEGRFALEAPIPTGTYEVAVAPIPLADPNLSHADRPTAVPRKFHALKSSGLTVEVKRGANDVVLELKD